MPLTAKDLIEAADKAQFMQWKARAKEVLGDATPDTKTEILAKLQEIADKEPKAPEPVAPKAAPEGAVEVNLLRNYVPRYLMDEDGKFIDQQSKDGSRNHERIGAGVTMLHISDAEKVLADGRATMTPNTGRQMAKVYA